MADNLRPEDRRKTMQAIKGKGTRLEKRLWAMLAAMRFKGLEILPVAVGFAFQRVGAA